MNTYIVRITNHCKECGIKHSTYTIDPPVTREVRKDALKQQKDYIAKHHPNHEYKLTVTESNEPT